MINRSSGKDFGLFYRVTIPERIAGARQFKRFTSIEAAEAWAKTQDDGMSINQFFVTAAAEKLAALGTVFLRSTLICPHFPRPSIEGSIKNAPTTPSPRLDR